MSCGWHDLNDQHVKGMCGCHNLSLLHALLSCIPVRTWLLFSFFSPVFDPRLALCDLQCWALQPKFFSF